MQKTPQEILEELLRIAGISFETVTIREDEQGTYFNIESDEMSPLVARDKEILEALTHLVKKIALRNKLNRADLEFSIDVGHYREERARAFTGKIRMLAERAKSLATEVTLEPMDGYARKAIHAVLENDPFVTTESRGKGADRHVVIKYVGTTDNFL